MKKKRKRAIVVKTGSIGPLIEQVRTLVQFARQAVANAVNTLQVRTNFEIGRLIVEHEQEGAARAEYGQELLKLLAERLTSEFGRGFSRTNLEYMRKFFLWQDRATKISQTVSGKLPAAPISQTVSGKLPAAKTGRKSDESASVPANPSSNSFAVPISQTLSGKFNLSWSHYVLLMEIRDSNERSFYEIESANSNRSFRELKRQVASCLYERLALSRDKKRVRQLAIEGQTITQPADLLKEPYILEFLGLGERPSYSETDFEAAIIDRLQQFLLELGKGFLFEARQKRLTFDEDHYFVDLVFYNRLLRCYVLFDIKLDKLSHQDLGQMQMYVNYYDQQVKLAEEHPTIGILLCKRKKDALVRLTLGAKANIFAAEYQMYLPSKDALRERLMEWTTEQETRR